MLVITRGKEESFVLTNKEQTVILARITVTDIRGDRVRIGIEASSSISILRKEIIPDNLVKACVME